MTGPNGDSGSVTYDTNARPTQTTSPYGAATTYRYNDTASPPMHTATTGSAWVRTTYDGFGRTVKTETGDGGGTKSIVDTIYAPCGCSPLGKVKQVSRPYAPGQTAVYTTYNYDGLAVVRSIGFATGKFPLMFGISGTTLGGLSTAITLLYAESQLGANATTCSQQTGYVPWILSRPDRGRH